VNPAHLFLGSNADNMRDKVAKGRQARVRGAANPACKLTPEQVRRIRDRRKGGESLKSIGDAFGVSFQTVSEIALGKRRADV
jgi:hypothetical protein